MDRLTNKNNGLGSWTQLGDKYLPAHNIKHKQCVNKLGKLEDIEEELGIDFITLLEIYKQLNIKKEVWFKYEKEMDEELKFMNSHRHKWVSYLIDFECKAFVEMEYEPVYYFYFKDYGKTWALTKEELL